MADSSSRRRSFSVYATSVSHSKTAVRAPIKLYDRDQISDKTHQKPKPAVPSGAFRSPSPVESEAVLRSWIKH